MGLWDQREPKLNYNSSFKMWKLYNPTQWTIGQADWIQNCMIHLSLCRLLGIMTQRYKPAKTFCRGAQLTSGILVYFLFLFDPNFTYVCIYLSIPKPFQPRDKLISFHFLFYTYGKGEKSAFLWCRISWICVACSRESLSLYNTTSYSV